MRCEICHQPAAWRLPLCNGCFADLPWNRHACRSCGEPLEPGPETQHPRSVPLCERCVTAPLPFRQVVIPLRYEFPIKEWIVSFKYREAPGLAQWLSQLLGDHLARQGPALPDLVLGVPMHAKPQRQRGYNQSLLLAHRLARRLDLEFSTSLLLKPKETAHQRGLNAAARRHNLRDAFELNREMARKKLQGRAVALVDDVVTTGATAAEIADILLNAGARSVDLWALAKTPLRAPLTTN